MEKGRFSSIRYIFIRSHLYGLFLTTVTLLSLLLTIHVLFSPSWLTINSIFLFMGLYIVLATIISLYTGFKSSSTMKQRLDAMSVLISQYANGNYETTIHFMENDELSRIANELNELGAKLQNQVKSLQRMADEKSDFAKTAHKAAVIEERQRIARDLHDAVSQQLFALTMMAEAATKQFDNKPELAKQQIEDVSVAALQAQTEMRALLLHLRPVHLSGDSLKQGIEKLIVEIERKNSIDFKLVIEDELSLNDTIEEHVFRIIQESISNILRHANASKVDLTITKRARELFLHIRDNGKGFDVTKNATRNTSYGLKTMRERSEELGGTFIVRSNYDEGTYIDIRIPC
ncbi:sensor histidine kinase [Oceanobacillus chungangensis]|uniref:Sensor histidine kinase n=1 Tax=Oceanobacillus chungangensis TaxID=1229152 RepID=A0A3D8PVW4_9BACI|nr:sensor histidine kinase [Oceanobacillus chungangensis]RDW19902.1 sensor histidine kinase [Oceanobacillus chungangensis]